MTKYRIILIVGLIASLLITTCKKDSTGPNDDDDNNTDELTYTITAEQTIDGGGGTLTEPNSNISIVVPQGALDGINFN